jgi:hypothetical protein
MIAPLPGLPSDPWRSASGREAVCVLMDRGLCTTTRCPQSVTVFFEKRGCRLVSGEQRKIDQLVSIVAETQLASIIAGGPSPFISTALFAAFASSLPIAFYILGCAVIGIVATALLTDYTNKDISEEYDKIGTVRAKAV